MKHLNVRHTTIKILEVNIGSKISDISRTRIFTDISPRARETKEKISGLYQNIKASAWQKKPSSKCKGNQIHGRTYLSMIQLIVD